MKSLKVVNPRAWKIGDTRDVTEDEIEKMIDADLYDSYDQTYELDNLRWKVTHRVAHPDGSTLYAMTAIEEA
jgi:hypothetical protein